jgi:hypothetical protein
VYLPKFNRLSEQIPAVYAFFVSLGIPPIISWLWSLFSSLVGVVGTIISGWQSYKFIKRWYDTRTKHV